MLNNFGVHPVQETLRHWLSARMEEMLQPASGVRFDFAAPVGEPALVPSQSQLWAIFKNPVTLFIGGVSAVILEFAEPKVRDGVWQNSSFRTDPMARLQRTGLAANVTVYGAAGPAKAMIAAVNQLHGRIAGVTTGGEEYQASDPWLLNWVQATATFGFLEAYSAFASPLNEARFDQAYRESAIAAKLYGAVGAPTSRAEQRLLFQVMEERASPSPIIFEFLEIMRNVPALPLAARSLQRPLVRAAVDILPPWARRRLGLSTHWSLRPAERSLVKLMARMADRIVIPASPAVQSCRRMGLPDDFLYAR